MPGAKRGNGFKPFEGKANEHHARITDSMMNCAAWRDMSISARYLYLEFKKKFNGKNDQEIVFTFAEARKLMSAGTFKAARDELIKNGFISITYKGKAHRLPSTYGLSDHWRYWPNLKTIAGMYTELITPTPGGITR